MRDLLERFGREVLMVTHDRNEAYNMSREIAVMDKGRVGGESLELSFQLLLQPVATSDKAHEHEHTPEHAEACEQRAALVACQRVDDFAICVEVYSQCFLFFIP